MDRIQLSNASFEGDNNVYLFDATQTTLVDTGDWTPETHELLSDGLAEHDLSFADVDRVFLTHWHGDHVGLAAEIQRQGGATVYVHEADAPLVAGEKDAWQALDERHERRFEQWGMPERKREELRNAFERPTLADSPEVTPIRGGDRFTVAGEPFTAVHAPGHAAGMCMYEYGDEVFSGDALLPKYTPNVGGADVRVDRPLEQYIETLEAVVARGYARAWPGHRAVIDDPAGRAREILTHHEERAFRVLDALSRLGPADAWTVSDDLFGTLESIHILHGPGEASAHLEHLERAGDVRREGTIYRLAEGTRDRLRGTENGRWPLR